MAINKKIILTGAACVAASVCFGALYYFMNGQGNPSIDAGKIVLTSREAPEPVTEPEPEPLVFGEPALGETGLARTLLRMNPDTVGWITVPNTKVDYPVVQGDDNAYYLDTGFDHKPYRAGAVFMDYRNVFGYDEEEQSENIVIYGHNMANNTMFGSLRRYRQDYTYYETNQFIELSSNFEHYSYVIFGLVIVDGSPSAAWRYWDMEELDTEQAFTDYVDTVRRYNLVDIDVDVQYGDQLLTLSTCYSDADDTRFLVIARKLREGETAETFAKPVEEETTETTEETTE